MYFATQNLLTAFQPIAYRIILVTLLVTLKTDGVQHTFLPMFFTVIRVQVPSPAYAEVAELADAHGSGPCGSNTLRVRLPSSAL